MTTTKQSVAQNPILVRLNRLDTCALSDALDSLGLPAAVSGLPPRTVQGRICGRVVTVKLEAGVPDGNGAAPHLGTKAIEMAEPGDVIVVEQLTGLEAAGWGGILSRAARMRGLSGVIVEGPARDIDEAAEIGFPVFSRAVTARTARGRVRELATGAVIRVGEVTVASGDYVAADSSGVVFISATSIERVLTAAEAIAAHEAAITQAILSGAPVTKVMGATYEKLLEGRR